MNGTTIEDIQSKIDAQLKRDHYPGDFPPLPDVPAARYHDAQFAAAEMQHMWKKTWLMVGVESELALPGSYFLFEELNLSIIIRRDNDGRIGAFHNICPHRGSALVSEPRGKLARFVCPYHSWSFGLDGRMLAAPEAHEFARLDKSATGLQPVQCELWRGLIFVNLDPEAAPLADFMAPSLPYTEGFPLEGLVVQDILTMEFDCNWKLAYHNFIEAYHTRAVHSKTLSHYIDQRSWQAYLLQNGHARIAVKRSNSDSIYLSDFPPPADIDAIFRKFSLCQVTFPNGFVALDPSGFAFQSFWPIGTNRCRMDIRMVGWEPKGTRPEYWEAIRAAMKTILAEDAQIFTALQRNVESGFLNRIMFGYLERTLYWFEEELDRRIGIENIAPPLRVVKALEGQYLTKTSN